MATVHFGRLMGPAGFARSVAIKRLHAHYAKDPEFVAMFLDEARLAARIVHPNVVPTLDVVVVHGELFLVMEYVRGASLSRLMRTVRTNQEPIPPRIVSSIMSGALQGLHAAHDAKNEKGERMDIVHRDVSPQNILVGTDGVARVLDFGVAKAVGRTQTTRDGQLKGKLSYMAPEQIRGQPVTRRTDVYAASVVLWEALVGKRLYKSDNEANVLAQVLEGNPKAPSSIIATLPASLDRLVLRGLDLEPGVRFATARDMASELVSCVPPATAEEVGEWVEAHAADELSERAARIADIELDSISSQSRLPPLGAAPPDAPTPVGQREVEPATTLAATRVQEVKDLPSVSTVSVSHPTEAPWRKPSGRWLWLILGACAGVGAVVLATRATPRSTAQPAASAGGNQGPNRSASVELPPAAPPPASPWPPTPDITPSVASPPPTPSAGPSVTPRTRSPARPPKPDCNPPYTTDDHGHIHFKPACL
jgi:serine/threonine protein kinase